MLVLRRIRKGKKISLQELSDATGVTIATLSLMERGSSNPKVGTLEKIARALGIQIGDLFAPIDYEGEGDE